MKTYSDFKELLKKDNEELIFSEEYEATKNEENTLTP
jgi:hypothetical protein